MYGSTTLSLPSPFANDHPPLRASSESSRPQPSGGCNFLLVQPSAKSRICACQVYHHNRSAPGNVCDCGHSACFHVHTFGDKVAGGAHGMKIDTVEKIKKLEDMIVAERQARENDRREYQQDMRSLREAMNAWYSSDYEIQQKLAQLEVRISTTTDEQRHMNSALPIFGNHSAHQNRDIDSASVHHTPSGRVRAVTSHTTDDVPGLTSGDDRSSTSSFSRHHTPSESIPALVEPESPRSSGILNLMNHPRPSVTPTYNIPRPIPQSQEEPRSSGFLGVEMGKRFPSVAGHKRPRQSLASSALPGPVEVARFHSRITKTPCQGLPRCHLSPDHRHLSTSISPVPSASSRRSLPRPSPQMNGFHHTRPTHPVAQQTATHGTPPTGRDIMPKFSSVVPFMAFDVLANVSTATTGLN